MDTQAMKDARKITLDAVAEAAIHWRALALLQVQQDEWEEANGRPFGNTSPCYRSRAGTYIKTATSLYRQAWTGAPHCSTCGGPHPNHQHGYPAPADPCQCHQAGCPWCSPDTTEK